MNDLVSQLPAEKQLEMGLPVVAGMAINMLCEATAQLAELNVTMNRLATSYERVEGVHKAINVHVVKEASPMSDEQEGFGPKGY